MWRRIGNLAAAVLLLLTEADVDARATVDGAAASAGATAIYAAERKVQRSGLAGNVPAID